MARIPSKLACFVLGVAVVLCRTPSATAQVWPDKPVRMIVAFTPGGLVDTIGRTLQPRLAEGLGQPVLVENHGGAGGTIAEGMLAKARPDGYTILITADNPPANPHLYRDLSYDFFRDLLPVTMLVRVPLVLVVNPSVPVASLADFVSYARARQGKFAYASPGSGTSNHLSMEVLQRVAGINPTHVPYKGGAQALADVIGGQVPCTLISITLAAPQVRSGRLKAVAVTGDKRTPLLPQVPTFAEGGYLDFPQGSWSGLFVPAGTPAALVERLYGETAKAIRAHDVQDRLQELGAETVMSSPTQFAAFLHAESARIGELVRENKITAD